jgi:hypothetical protein
MRAFLPILGACAAISVVAGQGLAAAFGMRAPRLAPMLVVLPLMLILVAAAASLLAYVLWLAIREREPKPIPRVLATIREYASIDFFATRLAPLVLVGICLSNFNVFKVLIPHVNPFFLDGFLSDLDRWVFGTDPWRLTHALIGPLGTRIVDGVYALWFPAWLLAILHFSLFADRDLQRRFFLSFLAAWVVVGIVLATLMSSAGPCFLGLIDHPYADRYAGLLPLKDAPFATRAQHYLADAYRSGALGTASGISAMPSVHIAVAAIMVLAFRCYGRLAFAASLFFYLMIFVGSVHLGWHYVSDGVIATAASLLLWRLARPKPRQGSLEQRQTPAPLALTP